MILGLVGNSALVDQYPNLIYWVCGFEHTHWSLVNHHITRQEATKLSGLSHVLNISYIPSQTSN